MNVSTRRKLGFALGLTLAAFGPPFETFAHGRFPLSTSVHPLGDGGLVIGTTFGLLLPGQDGGYDWVCSEAIGYGESFDPQVVIHPSGALFVGSPRGVFGSTDGCEWAPRGTPPLAGLSALQGLPDAGLLASVAATPGGLHRSDDQGATWAKVLDRPELLITSALASETLPERWYATATVPADGGGVLLVSDNGGATWSEEALPLAKPGSVPRLLALSSANSSELAVAFQDDATDRLLWGHEGGRRWVLASEVPSAWRSATFSPDGTVLWAAASEGGGLHRVTAGGAGIERLAEPRSNACAASRAGTLFTCGAPELDGWAAASFDAADGGTRARVRWEEVRGPKECPEGSSVQAQCPILWANVQLQLRRTLWDGGAPLGAEDAGTGDDDAADLAPPPIEDPGCACDAPGGSLAAALLLTLVLTWRARRAR